MEFAKKINGAVFFIDILGIGALTQNGLQLTKLDYEEWLKEYDVEYNNQFFATALLSEFRKVLTILSKKYPDVKIAQLSDCAFIWSEDIADVLLFSNNCMTELIKSGLLCRAGLACGEIIETTEDKNHNLGKFIVGEAVTKAVKLESLSKGVRILIDENVPQTLYEQNKDFANQLFKLFQPFTNKIDYTVYDEFKWYIVPNLDKSINLSKLNNEDKVFFTKEKLKLASLLRFSPKFHWNILTKQGFVHVQASIDFLTAYDTEVFKIWHDFRWASENYINGISDKEARSNKKVERVENSINNEMYKYVIKKEESNKIITKFIDI